MTYAPQDAPRKNIEFVSHSDQGGRGDGVQIMVFLRGGRDFLPQSLSSWILLSGQPTRLCGISSSHIFRSDATCGLRWPFVVRQSSCDEKRHGASAGAMPEVRMNFSLVYRDSNARSAKLRSCWRCPRCSASC